MHVSYSRVVANLPACTCDHLPQVVRVYMRPLFGVYMRPPDRCINYIMSRDATSPFHRPDCFQYVSKFFQKIPNLKVRLSRLPSQMDTNIDHRGGSWKSELWKTSQLFLLRHVDHCGPSLATFLQTWCVQLLWQASECKWPSGSVSCQPNPAQAM